MHCYLHEGALTAPVSVLPNPSLKRTRNGMPPLALISFWAKRVTPLRAAYLER